MTNKTTSVESRDKYGMTPDDWARLNALSDEEITAAALSDPDAQPITPEQRASMRRPRPQSKVVRHKLRMTQETFAAAYGIPLATLEAWERHQVEPSETELNYLRLIEREPERAKLAKAS